MVATEARSPAAAFRPPVCFRIVAGVGGQPSDEARVFSISATLRRERTLQPHDWKPSTVEPSGVKHRSYAFNPTGIAPGTVFPLSRRQAEDR